MRLPSILFLLLVLLASSAIAAERQLIVPDPTEAFLGASPGVAASDGRSFLVIWPDEGRAGVTDLYGVVLDAEGAIIRPRFQLTSSIAADSPGNLRWLGDSYLLIYYGTPGRVSGMRLNERGDPIGPEFQFESVSAISDIELWRGRLVAISSGHIVLFDLDGRLLARQQVERAEELIVEDGDLFAFASRCSPCTTGNMVVFNFEIEPDLRIGSTTIVDSEQFGVLFLEGDSSGNSSLTTWSSFGTHRALFEVWLTDDGKPKRKVYEREGIVRDLVWTGRYYLVIWLTEGNPQTLFGIRFSADGRLLDNEPIELSPPRNTRYYGIAAPGVGGAVILQDGIYGSLIDAAGSVVRKDFEISTSPAVQDFPALSDDGALVAWRESRGRLKSPRIAVAPLSGAAVHFVGESIVNLPPAIAGDGSRYLVAWTNGPKILGRLLGPDGTPVDTTTLEIGHGGTTNPIGVAWNGNEFLVVWGRPSTIGGEVIGVRVSRDGILIDPAPVQLGRGATDVQVEWTGSDYLLVSSVVTPPCVNICLPPVPNEIVVRRISRSLTVIDEASLARKFLYTASFAQNDSAILIASAESDAGIPRGLVVQRLDRDLDPVSARTLVGPRTFSPPRVVWDGQRFRVIYATASESLEVRQTIVARGGTPETTHVLKTIELPATGFAIAADPQFAVARVGTGAAALVYSRYGEDEPITGLKRLFVRRLDAQRQRGARR